MARSATAPFSLLFRFAVEGLRGQRIRSLLTILGMAIGTASVVAVVSIGLFGRDYIISLIEGVGSNLVFAYGTGGMVNRAELDFDDLEVFRRRVTGITAMAPVITANETIAIRTRPWSVNVLGAPPEYMRVRNLVVGAGRFISEQEEASAAKVAVISRELALEMFGTIDVAEEWIRLFNLRFRIVGVFREGVESAAALQKSEAAGLTAIIPFSTLKSISDVRYVDVVYFQAKSPAHVPSVVALVREALESRHPNMGNFKIESLDQYLVLVDRISRAVSLGLIAIAAVSLLVGGIGIMNIMLVTVTERTQDIGIRFALGAGKRDILLQFLIEAAILSGVGGVLGLALGVGVPVYGGLLYGFEIPISLTSIGVAFGVSVGVGLFFGVYPARKAANMNIIDALGYQ